MLATHIEQGSYGSTSIDGLNVVLAVHAEGAMGSGGWKVGIYLDERANDAQRQALQAIFSGGEGGPMAAFAPLIGEILGVKFVPITFSKEGRRRSVEVPGIVQMAVQGIPGLAPDSEVWVAAGHPFAPDRLALASGDPNSTLSDYGMRWDNSGKNGHYAAISWANP